MYSIGGLLIGCKMADIEGMISIDYSRDFSLAMTLLVNPKYTLVVIRSGSIGHNQDTERCA